ncbi:TBPIP-domain-containing protein [Mycena olivaceomarginata]|nr:TBPIP-domain-containing protein [Mycena olivaceomarginata]
MAPKSESKAKSDVKILKGQDAEDLVLDYVKRMNRPYGAVDVAANLKGAVPKTAVQKILVALAEKGELVQKTYGKTSFFVANQANIESIPAERFAELEAETNKTKSTPTDADLDVQISEITEAIKKANAQLQPLRSGAPLISAEDLEQVEADWMKWRTEWIRRKKIFNEYDPFPISSTPDVVQRRRICAYYKLSFWHIATDALPPQDATTLAEDLGIEQDTNEHSALERSPLVTAQKNLKRKR